VLFYFFWKGVKVSPKIERGYKATHHPQTGKEKNPEKKNYERYLPPFCEEGGKKMNFYLNKLGRKKK